MEPYYTIIIYEIIHNVLETIYSTLNSPPSFGDDHFGAKLMKFRPQFGTFQMTSDTRQDVILVISQIGSSGVGNTRGSSNTTIASTTCCYYQAFLHEGIIHQLI